MTHDEKTKARALAVLALSDTPSYVAAQLGLPRTTVRRWQPEARAIFADAFSDADRAALADIAQTVVAIFPGLLQQNSPIKRK